MSTGAEEATAGRRGAGKVTAVKPVAPLSGRMTSGAGTDPARNDGQFALLLFFLFFFDRPSSSLPDRVGGRVVRCGVRDVFHGVAIACHIDLR